MVPYDRKTDVGWRPLSVSNAQLKKYLQSLLDAKARGAPPDFTELDRLITCVEAVSPSIGSTKY